MVSGHLGSDVGDDPGDALEEPVGEVDGEREEQELEVPRDRCRFLVRRIREAFELGPAPLKLRVRRRNP